MKIKGDNEMIRLKNLTKIATVMLLSIALVGCGSKASTDKVNENNSNEVTNEESNEGTTKVIATAKGDIEIPVNPKRVVVDYFMGDVLALGVTPVGTTYVYEGAVFEEELKDVPSFNGDDSYGEYSLETIVSMEPDLIITYSETDYDSLSKIAPTVYVNYLEITSKERVELIASALGKEEEAATLLAEFDQLVEESIDKLKAAGALDKTITLMETYNKEVFVYGDKQGRGGEVLYSLLGLKGPEIVQNEIIGGEQYRSISLEVLGEYIGDFVMIGGWQEDPLDLVGDNSAWLATDAVKNDNVILYDSSAFIYQDILSTKAQLIDITDAILSKIQ